MQVEVRTPQPPPPEYVITLSAEELKAVRWAVQVGVNMDPNENANRSEYRIKYAALARSFAETAYTTTGVSFQI